MRNVDAKPNQTTQADARTTGVILFLCVWAVIAVVAATTSFIAMEGSTLREWLSILGYMLSYFYAWAIISIAINWLIRRGSERRTGMSLQLAAHLVFLSLVTISLPVLLHPGNWESWLFGERSVGFHALNAFIYSFVLIGSMMVNYYRMSRANEAAAHAAELRQIELERSLQKSRMDALRAQINPHFLFNALNSTASLIESSSNQEAYDLVAQIADLLRNALDFSRDGLVTVAEELRFLDAYLAIENVRYASRLNVTRVVPETCLVYDVPSFSLQPLLENVIKHAVSKTTEPVCVQITVSCADEVLTLEVRDDGPGLHSPLRPGVGLANIRERLQYLFGDKASLVAENREVGGAVVTLTVPAQTTVSKKMAPTKNKYNLQEKSPLIHATN